MDILTCTNDRHRPDSQSERNVPRRGNPVTCGNRTCATPSDEIAVHGAMLLSLCITTAIKFTTVTVMTMLPGDCGTGSALVAAVVSTHARGWATGPVASRHARDWEDCS